MTDEELKRKDWQILTARALMSNQALMQLVIENQSVIISELKKIPLSDVTKKMTEYTKENYNKVVKNIENNIPNYDLIDRKF